MAKAESKIRNKHIEKCRKTSFLTIFDLPPFAGELSTRKTLLNKLGVAIIDEQLWFHEGFVNVKFEGSKVRKTSKNVIFTILQSVARAPRELDTCANTSKLTFF